MGIWKRVRVGWDMCADGFGTWLMKSSWSHLIMAHLNMDRWKGFFCLFYAFFFLYSFLVVVLEHKRDMENRVGHLCCASSLVLHYLVTVPSLELNTTSGTLPPKHQNIINFLVLRTTLLCSSCIVGSFVGDNNTHR